MAVPGSALARGRTHRFVRFIPDQVWVQLKAYDWPGNVRELRNVLERCVLLAADETLPGHWLRLGSAPQFLRRLSTRAWVERSVPAGRRFH